jgi:hypothetical protein
MLTKEEWRRQEEAQKQAWYAVECLLLDLQNVNDELRSLRCQKEDIETKIASCIADAKLGAWLTLPNLPMIKAHLRRKSGLS